MRNPTMRLLAAVVLMLLASTSCRSTATVTVDDRGSGSRMNSDVVLEPPAELPVAFSNVASVGDMGFYYSASNGQMSLIAFDAASREARYQLAASPLGRIRGVGQGVLVDDERGLVFITGNEDDNSEDGAYLAAHDATTGAEVWRTSIDYYSAQPRDCGTSICLRSFDEQRVIDKASGSAVDEFDVNDRRVLLDRDDLWITTRGTSATGAFAGVSGSLPGSPDELWKLSTADIEEKTGAEVDPGMGWRADFDDENQAAIVYLANADGSGWVAFGVDVSIGTITWGRTDLDPCVDSPFTDRPPVGCTWHPDLFLRSIERIHAATGQTVWAHTLDNSVSEMMYDGSDIIIWQAPDTSAEFYERLDLATGEPAVGSTPVPCVATRTSHDFAYPDDEVTWWAAATLYTLCSTNGYQLAAEDVTAAAATIELDAAELWLTDSTGVPLAPVD